MITYKIYGLKLKNDDTIRYIGQTKQTLADRFSNHICDLRAYNKKTNWIRKYKSEIEMVLIEDNITSLEESNIKEIFYIKLLTYLGANLVNSTLGGDGKLGHKHDDAFRKRASDRMKNNNPMKNPECRLKQSFNKKGVSRGKWKHTSPLKGKMRVDVDSLEVYKLYLTGEYTQKELSIIFKVSHGTILNITKKYKLKCL